MDCRFGKICRVCMEGGKLTSLFVDNILPASLMIMYCTSVKIAKNDCLPSEICLACMDRLVIAFQFKRQCENTDHQFRKLLDNNTSLKWKEIKSNTERSFHDNLMGDDILETVEVKIENEEKREMKPSTEQINITKIAAIRVSDIKIDSEHKQNVHKTKIRSIMQNTNFKRKSKNDTANKNSKNVSVHKDQKSYECTICQKMFSVKINLITHLRTHTGEKPFQCEICSKQFTTCSNLRAHFNVHNQTRNYQCPECPRAFKTSREFSCHSGTHTGIKNHVCKECGKAFYKTNYLNSHIKTVHNGVKNFMCTECGKHFSSSSNLRCHFRIHTGEKPFSCNTCGACFNQSAALHRHKKQHSKIRKKDQIK